MTKRDRQRAEKQARKMEKAKSLRRANLQHKFARAAKLPKDAPRHVSLLCGMGGWSCGLERAGIRTILALDADARAVETHAANFPEAHHICGKVEDVNPVEWEMLYGVERGADNLIFTASPPCQQWSAARADKRESKPREDGNLTLKMMPLIFHFCPKFLLMENVRGYAKHADQSGLQELRENLFLHGYAVEERIINCADYGVPQHRVRWFMSAQRMWKRNDKVRVEPGPGGSRVVVVGDDAVRIIIGPDGQRVATLIGGGNFNKDEFCDFPHPTHQDENADYIRQVDPLRNEEIIFDSARGQIRRNKLKDARK